MKHSLDLSSVTLARETGDTARVCPSSPQDHPSLDPATRALVMANEEIEDRPALDSEDNELPSPMTAADPSVLLSSDGHDPYDLTPLTPSFEPQVKSHVFTEEHRYLLHHYADKVVRLFGVFGNDVSPWKTIQVPCAFEAAGELMVLGKCSLIRHALLQTLLAASAFILSSDCVQNLCKYESRKWLEVAVQLRGQAVGRLKESVSQQFHSLLKLPYKDFLVTMLSMVSIDVRGTPAQMDEC
jgi:hypothetical protein